MGVRGADYQTYNTNAEEIIFHKKVNFNAGVNIIGSPGSGGVDSGQYGSASEVPVITVNASGLVDSIGTVNVAGVTSISFDSASYNFTINTADGGVFTKNDSHQKAWFGCWYSWICYFNSNYIS